MIAALLAPLLALLCVAAVTALLALQRRHQRRLLGRVLEPAAAPAASTAAARSARPRLLYFTGRACAICHTTQRPAVHRVAEALGDRAAIREIDVADDPDLARRYRVMALPTLVVLGPGGEVAAVNVGFTEARTLEEQLVAAGAGREAGLG